MRRPWLRHDWADLDDEALLDIRMSGLPLTIEGTLNGSEHKVIYPLRRIDCETGESIRR